MKLIDMERSYIVQGKVVKPGTEFEMDNENGERLLRSMKKRKKTGLCRIIEDEIEPRQEPAPEQTAEPEIDSAEVDDGDAPDTDDLDPPEYIGAGWYFWRDKKYRGIDNLPAEAQNLLED